MINTIYDAGFHTPHDDRITKTQLNWFMDIFDVHPSEVPGLTKRGYKVLRWSEKAMNILYTALEAPWSFLPSFRPELRLATDVANVLDGVFSIRKTDPLDKYPADIVEGVTETIKAIKKRAYEEGYKAGYADGAKDGEADGYDEGFNAGKEEADKALDHALASGKLKVLVDNLSGIPYEQLRKMSTALTAAGIVKL